MSSGSNDLRSPICLFSVQTYFGCSSSSFFINFKNKKALKEYLKSDSLSLKCFVFMK